MQGAVVDALKERLRSLNVLIVDDNAFMRKIVRELLADLGSPLHQSPQPACWPYTYLIFGRGCQAI